jgi:glycosyltransferase involved in cell wall biosynthesis
MVHYLGQLEHQTLWKLMSQAYGLLFSITGEESFGLVPVEAMATGTPVIAFARGPVGEVIQDGETGFLVPPGDCARAAELVPELASLSRASCREHVATRFSHDAMLEEYENLYREMVKKG